VSKRSRNSGGKTRDALCDVHDGKLKVGMNSGTLSFKARPVPGSEVV
jgi:hypothetical protein